MVSGDAKAGTPAAVIDLRVVVLTDEAWRHAKVIAAVGDPTVLSEARITDEGVGVLVGPAAELAPHLPEQLAEHRCWNRFATSLDAAAEG